MCDPNSLCILLSTCDAYSAVAEQTRRMLARHWPGHPPVLTCGRSGTGEENQLPFHGPDRDWIGITRQAFHQLRERGYAWAYLILDDHPPMGPCNVDYLNHALPRQAEALSALQVNLLGWDQYQPQHGRVLPALYLNDGGHSELVEFGGLGFRRTEEIQGLLDRLIAGYESFANNISVDSMDDLAQKYIDCVRYAGVIT